MKNDRLSYLPDSILVDIISLLPFEEAARTSVLSKRWINLWKSTTNIEFDENYFIENHIRRELIKDCRNFFAASIRSSGKARFMKFAKQFVLNYREGEIRKFRLCISHPRQQEEDIHYLIKFALDKNVKELDLDFSDIDTLKDHPTSSVGSFDLPEYVYDHNPLIGLKLTGCDFDTSQFRKFKSLKSLSISRIELDHDQVEALLKNCQLLEAFSVKKCSDMNYLNISCELDHPLASLTIESCWPLTNGVNVNVPKLRSFKFFGAVETFFLDNLLHLHEAEFNFGLEDVFYEHGNILAEILRGVDCAKVLTLDTYMLQVITSGDEPLHLPTPLLCLKHLILKTGLHKNELPGVASILRSCHVLETLTLEMGHLRELKDYVYPYNPVLDGSQFWQSQVLPFKCLRKHLKTVEVMNFTGSDNEFQMLKFLLENAKVLKEVIIIISEDDTHNVERLRSHWKASPSVQIKVSHK